MKKVYIGITAALVALIAVFIIVIVRAVKSGNESEKINEGLTTAPAVSVDNGEFYGDGDTGTAANGDTDEKGSNELWTAAGEAFTQGGDLTENGNYPDKAETGSAASLTENAVTALPTAAYAIPGTTSSANVTTAKQNTSTGGSKSKGDALTVAQTENAATGSSTSDYEYSYAGFNPQQANFNIDDWRLLLVNRDYILSSDYVPTLALSVTGDSDSKKLDYRVAPHYNEMYLAAKNDGITLTTLSGYRSYDKQKTNFENKIAKYMGEGYSKIKATQEAATIILPPGTSEHNAGLAMDICSLYESFENTSEFKWLKANASDYGFILRYPKDKQDVTKIIYEPWHWRYVGKENAKAIENSGLCLEEWLETR